MPKLTDTQAILLSTAAQRPDGSLLPPSVALGATTDRIRKAVATLIKRALAEEVAVLAAAAWRSEDDRHWGAAITDAGRLAIGVEPVLASDEECTPSWMVQPSIEAGGESATAQASPPAAARQTKAALVLDLLRREQGATLAELVEATGWLPHTTRAALTGLRKKGHSIAKGKRDEATCYAVANAA